MTPVTRLLAPLAWVFGAAVTVRRVLYRIGVLPVAKAGVPVIVVGNITLGGSGKTPLVLWIVHYLATAGWRPGIVSRGYGGSIAARGAPPAEVSIGSDAAEVGDEPLMLARRTQCPVWVGADRAAVARALRVQHPQCDVLVLDDGLQHYGLARDVEIAVLDARGLGNGRLFPAGPLREPAARLASVDAVVHTIEVGAPRNAASRSGRPDAPAAFSMWLAGERFERLAEPGRMLERAALGSARVHAVAGIGNPARFFAHLSSLGLEVVPHPFPDHHRFTPADLAFDDGLPIVMTEKDAVKCRGLAMHARGRESPNALWVLPVSAQLDPAFGPLLESKLARAHAVAAQFNPNSPR